MMEKRSVLFRTKILHFFIRLQSDPHRRANYILFDEIVVSVNFKTFLGEIGFVDKQQLYTSVLTYLLILSMCFDGLCKKI